VAEWFAGEEAVLVLVMPTRARRLVEAHGLPDNSDNLPATIKRQCI
jgi:hypothetical protein